MSKTFFLVGISNNLSGAESKRIFVVMASENAAEKLESKIQHYGGMANTFHFDMYGDVGDAQKYKFISNNESGIKYLLTQLYPNWTRKEVVEQEF